MAVTVAETHQRASSIGRALIYLLVAVPVLWSCSPTGGREAESIAGTAETDRIAQVVADAISYPRRDSAEALTRAALETNAGRDGRLSVVTADELSAGDLVAPLARLVFRVHLEGYEAGLISVEPVTACYEVFFNYYGVIEEPERVTCAPDARPITPGPVAPTPQPVIPDGAEVAVEQVLHDLPEGVTVDAVTQAVAAALPGIRPDPETGITNVPVPPEVEVVRSDIGVSLWEPGSRRCLFGTRIGNRVTVWFASRDEVQPGELSCDPATAIALVMRDQ